LLVAKAGEPEVRERRSHYDVTNSICISDPQVVADAVCGILQQRFPKADFAPVQQAFDTFAKLYAGILPGYHGCDTWYHDAQHSLDCTLAMARLLDGHERSVPKAKQLGERRARLGVISALFHDSGYIRRYDESQFHNGAQFTFYHVTRSANFLMDFLPAVGFAKEAKMAGQLVHFTGYEIALDKIAVRNPKDRRLGFMLGTADLIAQMADRCYLEKCRNYLFHEFRACGLAAPGVPGGPKPVYQSPDDLIRKTPEFAQKLFDERLDGYFEGMYRYMEPHFNGINPYLMAIEKHLEHVRRMIELNTLDQLRRKPRSINARVLRGILNVRLAQTHPHQHRVKLRRSRRIGRTRLRPQQTQYIPT
jgi:hypothetical protein